METASSEPKKTMPSLRELLLMAQAEDARVQKDARTDVLVGHYAGGHQWWACGRPQMRSAHINLPDEEDRQRLLTLMMNAAKSKLNVLLGAMVDANKSAASLNVDDEWDVIQQTPPVKK